MVSIFVSRTSCSRFDSWHSQKNLLKQFAYVGSIKAINLQRFAYRMYKAQYHKLTKVMLYCIGESNK